MGLGLGGLQSGGTVNSTTVIPALVGQDIVARSISLTQASGSNAVSMLDGARLNLSTADASAYFARSAANTIQTPGSLQAITQLILGNASTSLSLFGFSSGGVSGEFTTIGGGATFVGSLQIKGLAANGGAETAVVIGNGATLASTQSLVQFRNGASFSSTKVGELTATGVFSTPMGTSTTLSPHPSVANVNTTAVGNVGASGPDDLITYSLPANALSANGKGVRVKCWGTTANNANAKTVQFVFGTVTFAKQLTASVAGRWEFEALVFRTGSSTQDIWVEATNYGGTTVSSTDGATVQNLATFTTGTETDTGIITIKCQSTVSTANDDIVQEGMLVEFIN